MKTLIYLFIVAACMATSLVQGADKTFIDYFLPMPIEGELVSDVWGTPGVFPRDPRNGLEDETLKLWTYLLGWPDYQGPGGQVSHLRKSMGPNAGP